jgi:single-stranded-DNA-specific exonuclease
MITVLFSMFREGIQNSAYSFAPGDIFHIRKSVILKWVVTDPPDQETLKELVDVLGVPRVIAKILYNRGITSLEDAKLFFKSDWNDLYDPFLMKDMDKATDRVIQALQQEERIFIYGDYDVDGITGVSLLILFLKEQGGDVVFYIPNRLQEGYGLSTAGIEQAFNVGAKLLISVDCGITGIDEVALARQRGIDVIVSDHHEPSSTLPDSIAILDPKREDCQYPFKELAGVGVAFKLVQAVSQKLDLDEKAYRQYIDLVALGSAADIVPMIDENRLLVKKGLESINRHERLGIKALVDSSGLSRKKIGTGQIVFILAPRINAVGRLGNAERAVRLLINDSEQQARNIANILESENRNRKSIDEETFQEALELIESVYDEESDHAVVLSKEGWHSGVIGIVASRIAEHVYRPTIMIAVENGIGKGSARSISNFDIYSALQTCEQYLLGFGGHRYAAGLTIELEKIDSFRKAFKKAASEMVTEDDLIQRLKVDAEIAMSEITPKLIRILNQFAPFGPQNMRPVFLSRNLQVVGTPRVVGKNHLKFRVRQKGGEVFDAIGFDLGKLHYCLTPGEENLDMVYVVEENYWNDQVKIQLRVKDLR